MKKIFKTSILYLECYCSRLNIIIMGLGYLLLTIIFLSMTNIGYDKAFYQIYSDEFHSNYFNQTILLIRVYLALFVLILISYEANPQMEKLNQMLQPCLGRTIMYVAKMKALMQIISIYVIIIIATYILIPTILYPNFCINIEQYNFLFYLILEEFIIIVFGFVMITLINSQFISFLSFIIYVMILIMEEKFQKILKFIFPVFKVNGIFSINCSVNFLYSILYLLILYIIGLLIYEKHTF